MSHKVLAVLEFSDPQVLRTCPGEELVFEPLRGSQFVYRGALYRVEEMPIISIGGTVNGAGKTSEMRLAEILVLVHGDSPTAIALFSSKKSLAEDNLDEERSAGGLILPSHKTQVDDDVDGLVYIRLSLVKRCASTPLLELLGAASGKPAPVGQVGAKQ